MNRFVNKAGLIVAASIPILILPARISEGQWKDPVNLIGSEIVIFLMSLTCWYAIIYIQRLKGISSIIKVGLSILCCCLMSNLFFFTFNPIFKDFPFRTAQNPLHIRILMLSSRGILMSIILVPAANFLKKDQEARKAVAENERLAMQKIKIENALLEQTVIERTKALEETLESLKKSQDELKYQFYIQSRLVASITHDVQGPFGFLIQISEEIERMVKDLEDSNLRLYTTELTRSLEAMFTFIKNLLEFTKLPLLNQLSKTQEVDLEKLVREKSELFKGAFTTRNNELIIQGDNGISVRSNYNLLGIILHNLIDNANKHTRSGSIELNFEMTDQIASLTVKNTGIQVASHITEWINSEYDIADPEIIIDSNRVKGIGLVLVKEIGKLLDIDLSMSSDDTDTTVTLTFSAV